MESVDHHILTGTSGCSTGYAAGTLVAQNIRRLIHKKEMKPFRYKHQGSMATVGRNRAVVDLQALRHRDF